MATITKTIGTSSTIDTETPSSCSGSNPYTVTFTNDPSGVVVGDKVYITDEASYYDTFIYNVTGISGSGPAYMYLIIGNCYFDNFGVVVCLCSQNRHSRLEISQFSLQL